MRVLRAGSESVPEMREGYREDVSKITMKVLLRKSMATYPGD
jgi:hypothetical protein